MKRNSPMRYVYGVGLIAAAAGFALPLVNLGWLLGGDYSGFDLARTVGSFDKFYQYLLYFYFGVFCAGGVLACVPKLRVFDVISFGLMVGGAVVAFFHATGGKVSSSSGGSSWFMDMFGDSIKNLVMNILQPGAWILLGGLAVAVVGFILSFVIKGKRR